MRIALIALAFTAAASAVLPATGAPQIPTRNTNPDCYWPKHSRIDPTLQCQEDFEPLPQRPPPVGTLSKQSSYIRTLLNYDIDVECKKGIYSMTDAISRGDVVPNRDIPRCVADDVEALKYLDENWNKLPQNGREACLAAFGSASGKGLMMRYHVLATCAGKPFR